ncbi:12808_t:CDS:2 [Acaulospora morrowiae]|uniref:12808_t:CDS:1 n=1 Tax=Acaulospora morrowiae TaxID=94023 RepID=A0A9N8VL45_9GLOM|nr:12808_t:CDS:2 [Acaulospora morrowiae]
MDDPVSLLVPRFYGSMIMVYSITHPAFNKTKIFKMKCFRPTLRICLYEPLCSYYEWGCRWSGPVPLALSKDGRSKIENQFFSRFREDKLNCIHIVHELGLIIDYREIQLEDERLDIFGLKDQFSSIRGN